MALIVWNHTIFGKLSHMNEFQLVSSLCTVELLYLKNVKYVRNVVLACFDVYIIIIIIIINSLHAALSVQGWTTTVYTCT